MYCIEESTCDIVGTLWRPHSDSATWEFDPFPPLLLPCLYAHFDITVVPHALFLS